MAIKIIAETASNHMGSMQNIKKSLPIFKKVGVDMITYQILHPESFSTYDYSKYNFYKQLELSYSSWEEIYNDCKNLAIEFIPCFFDTYSFNSLKHLEFKHIKLHAADIFNRELVQGIIKYNPDNIILETQACNIHDIDLALQIFEEYDGNLILFHGFSGYSAKLADHNLRMLHFLRDRYQLQVGFKDSSLDTKTVPLMAIAAGAEYLEKHITLQREQSDFDAQVSLEPEEFKSLIENIRKYEITMGNYLKYPVGNELKDKNIIHKKVYLKKDVCQGDIIDWDHINFVRTNQGFPAGRVGLYYQKRLDKDLKANSILEAQDFKRDKITIAVIARLASKRLTKKALRKIDDKPLLGLLIERLKLISNENINIVLATSYLPQDQPLVELAKEYQIDYYCGDPDNVLDRLVNIGEKYHSSAILRVTGDNIATDIKLVNILIKEFLNSDLDYIRTNNIPLGVSPEIFSLDCLYRIYDDMGSPETSGYLTIYANKPNLYRVGVIALSKKYYFFNNRFSIDTIEDFQYLEEYFKFLKEKGSTFIDSDLNDICEFIRKNPLDEELILQKSFKLPQGESITYREFNQQLEEFAQQSKILDYRGQYE